MFLPDWFGMVQRGKVKPGVGAKGTHGSDRIVEHIRLVYMHPDLAGPLEVISRGTE